MPSVIFHLAFPIHHLEETKRFYVDGLGCTLGRVSDKAITLELGGHQLVGHLSPPVEPQKGIYPRHFGLIFGSEQDWQALVDQARKKGLPFYQAPRRRFEGTRLEHATVFLEDPSHHLLEFKWYKYPSAIFGEHEMKEVGDTSDEAQD